MTSDDDPQTAGRSRRRRRRRRPKPPTPPGTSDQAAATEPAGARGAEGGAKRRRRRRSTRSGTATASEAQQAADGSATAKQRAGGRSTTAKRRSGARSKAAKRRTPTITEVSAGGVVYRREEGQIEMLLAARRTRRGALAWGLAKGGIEDGETIEHAAIREVREETGIDAEIEESLGETRYTYVWEDVRIRKTVHFFLMRAVGGDPADHDDEMEDVRWFPLERALKRAAYRGERAKLQRAAELLR